jgi:hypothetical protein
VFERSGKSDTSQYATLARSIKSSDIVHHNFSPIPWTRDVTFFINKEGLGKQKKAKMIIYATNEKGKDEKISDNEFFIHQFIGAGAY